MSRPNKPRWFRFGLRTLFVVVTVFGIWLGLQVKWIKDRREFLTQKGISYFSASHLPVDEPTNPFEDAPIFEPTEPKSAPGLLWLLGEEGVFEIWFAPTENSDGDEQRRHEAERLFPEANLIIIDAQPAFE